MSAFPKIYINPKKKRFSMTSLESLMEAYIKRGSITCVECFAMAKKSGVTLKEIGKFCNDHNIKIRNCQLGCFK